MKKQILDFERRNESLKREKQILLDTINTMKIEQKQLNDKNRVLHKRNEYLEGIFTKNDLNYSSKPEGGIKLDELSHIQSNKEEEILDQGSNKREIVIETKINVTKSRHNLLSRKVLNPKDKPSSGRQVKRLVNKESNIKGESIEESKMKPDDVISFIVSDSEKESHAKNNSVSMKSYESVESQFDEFEIRKDRFEDIIKFTGKDGSTKDFKADVIHPRHQSQNSSFNNSDIVEESQEYASKDFVSKGYETGLSEYMAKDYKKVSNPGNEDTNKDDLIDNNIHKFSSNVSAPYETEDHGTEDNYIINQKHDQAKDGLNSNIMSNQNDILVYVVKETEPEEGYSSGSFDPK